jgi:cobalt-zinc-cadmium efflux system outer membrane protein
VWTVAVPSLAAQPGPDTLTFERATRLWTQNNPQLRAARARAQATDRGARAASLYPNPSLSVSQERTNLPAGVDDQWYTSISQPIRYPGEHGARRRSADATGRAAEARMEETRTQLFNTLRHRYLDVVTARARVDVLRSFATSIRSAARAARVRHEEGDLGPMRRARMQVAQAQYETDLADAEQRLHTARMELASLLRPDAQRPLAPVAGMDAVRRAGSMPGAPATVDADSTLARALRRRGTVQAAAAQIDARTADVDAARYEKYPSLRLSAGPKRQSVPAATTYGYTAGLSIGLPLWNGGETAVEASRHRRRAATAALDATRRRVTVQVRSAVKRLDSYRHRLQTVSDTVLAATDSLGTDARFVYRQGEISLFELLDALDAARRAALLRIDLTAGYLRALYDLEAAVGVGPADAPFVIDGALHPRDAALR